MARLFSCLKQHRDMPKQNLPTLCKSFLNLPPMENCPATFLWLSLDKCAIFQRCAKRCPGVNLGLFDLTGNLGGLHMNQRLPKTCSP